MALTKEARAHVEQLIADHEAWKASPEGLNAARIDREFREAVEKLIAECGAERTLWIVSDSIERETKDSFAKAFNAQTELMRNLER